MFEALLAELGMREDQAVYLDDTGHMSGVDPLLGLDRAVRDGRVRSGDAVLLLSAGTGYTWAATVVGGGKLQTARATPHERAARGPRDGRSRRDRRRDRRAPRGRRLGRARRRRRRRRPHDARGKQARRRRRASIALGRLDAIVPNAGFQHVAPVREFPEEQWDKLLALLLTSPFLLAKYAWDALAASGDGRICVIASAHALTASPFKAGYVSAKHGVLGLVKTLALEGAEVRDQCHGRLPGLRADAARRGADLRPGARARSPRGATCSRGVILERQAVKRLLEPSEVADVVAFLLGPRAAAFTGVPVPIDLGWTAR